MARFNYDDEFENAPRFEKNKKVNTNRRENEKSRDLNLKNARKTKETKRDC